MERLCRCALQLIEASRYTTVVLMKNRTKQRRRVKISLKILLMLRHKDPRQVQHPELVVRKVLILKKLLKNQAHERHVGNLKIFKLKEVSVVVIQTREAADHQVMID